VTRMGKAARFFAASFDTAVIGVLAFNETGGRFAATFAEYVLWGSVVAAGICAVVILADGLAPLAWIGIGYILFGGLLREVPTSDSSFSRWRSLRWFRGRAGRSASGSVSLRSPRWCRGF
jgi:hypothetical protein